MTNTESLDERSLAFVRDVVDNRCGGDRERGARYFRDVLKVCGVRSARRIIETAFAEDRGPVEERVTQ